MKRKTIKIRSGSMSYRHQAMQRLPRNRCLATGYSCRSQVKRVEGTGVRHPVQALLEIIK